MDRSGYSAREDHRADDTADTQRVAGPRHAGLTATAAMLNAAPPVQRLAAMRPPNRTGLPDRLKEGVEAMSGMSLDSVRVHYNSSQPAQLNALAYAQGSDIHVAPGQERHLPHEAWHVVQQAQGRVRPTMQMKGNTAINDDVGLEHEADVMGARALTLGGEPAPGPGGEAMRPTSLPAPDTMPRQLHVAPETRPNVAERKRPRFDDARWERSADTSFMDLNWPLMADRAYETINVARPNLEQDEEIAEIDALEAELDNLVRAGNRHIRTFDTTDPWERVAINNTLKGDMTNVTDVLARIQEKFVITEGGFSAKGRATAINNVDISEDNQGVVGRDDSFINTITIGDELLSDRVGVTKPVTAAAPGAVRLLVNGGVYNGTDDPSSYNDAMTALDVPQTANDISTFAARPRGLGQQVAMNNTNARGYAWATGTGGWNTTQWEWLHIRGASLGGETDATNLVVGTRDANTHMIPFESNLKSLAKLAREDDYFYRLNVTWDVAGRQLRHRVSTISIRWNLRLSNLAPDGIEPVTGEALFSPLATGSVLSKDEIGFLEDELRQARELHLQEEESESASGSGSGSDSNSDDVDMGGYVSAEY
ncbi:MAG: DUF4157 domain-containing protein [Pseudomonadota bacterium]